jgi:hypothetical protein
MKKDIIAHLGFLEEQARGIGYNQAQIELIAALKAAIAKARKPKDFVELIKQTCYLRFDH